MGKGRGVSLWSGLAAPSAVPLSCVLVNPGPCMCL